MSFNFHKSRVGDCDIIREDRQLGASLTVLAGDLLQESNGKLIFATAAGTPRFLALEDKTSGATDIVFIKVLDLSLCLLKHGITPLLDEAAVVSGTTTTVTAALSAGSTNDLVGGVVYLKEQDAHRIITANTYGSGNVVITFLEPLDRAPVAGEKVSMVPFGPSDQAVKLASSNPQRNISTAIADLSGGKMAVEEVRLDKKDIICRVAA